MNVHCADEAARPQARVVLSSPGVMSAADERLLLELLADCGLNARVESVPVRRGDAATLTWLVLAALPLQAFLSVLGTKVAEDSYARLRALADRLAARRRAPETAAAELAPADGGKKPDSAASVVPLVLVDPGTGLRIVLDADLPEDAYATLVSLDLSHFSIGPLHYDLARQRWRSELDEAAGG